jgi:hypothetical protein
MVGHSCTIHMSSVADISFCRSTLLSCICSYQITSGLYFEGKKLSVIALLLTLYILNASVINLKFAEDKRFV